jgi:hypothetical protein
VSGRCNIRSDARLTVDSAPACWRDAVLEALRGWVGVYLGVKALELIEVEDKVLFGISSVHLQEIAGVPLDGQIFNVLTLRGGRIVRIEDYARRDEALAAAKTEGRGDWG